MSIMTEGAAASEPKPGREAPPARKKRSTRRWLGRLWWLAIAALAVGNGWWAYENLKPLPAVDRLGALVNLKRYDEAEAGLTSILRRSPEDGAALMMLARVQGATGRLLESAETLGRVPFWWPSKRVALFLEGEAYNQANLARKAEQAWLACVRDDPLHPAPEIYYLTGAEALIGNYAMQERFDAARAVAWTCLNQVEPDDRQDVVFILMRTHVQRVVPSHRAEKLRKWVEADPEDDASRLALATAEFKLNHREEADRLFEICLERRPNDPAVYRDRLAMLKEAGDVDGMARLIPSLPNGSDDDADLWGFRGLVAENAGDLEKARECYEQEVARQPHDEEAYYRLAMVERRLGRAEKAREHLERNKVLREARGQMVAAYDDYFNAHRASVRDPEAIKQATQKLTSLCLTLGLDREARVL